MNHLIFGSGCSRANLAALTELTEDDIEFLRTYKVARIRS